MSASFLSKDLFNERTFDTLCTLENKDELKTTALLNTDNSEHAFIDKKFARKVCDKLNISFQELIKVKLIREYNEKTNVVIIYVIYFILTVNDHRKNLTSLLIIKLKNHKLILKRFWMKRHELILNMINDFFTFWSDHCDHFEIWRRKNSYSTYVDKDKNFETSSFNEASVKIEISFETISSADQKKDIFKRKTSSASSVENENEKVKAISKIERKNKFISKVERIINIKKKLN